MSASAHEFDSALYGALDAGKFVPHFQPIVSLQGGEIVGFEALTRWSDIRLGVVPPTMFIPRLDALGLLDRLLGSLMEQAFQAAAFWPAEPFLAFNVSPEQLRDSRLVERIETTANAHDYPLDRIHIEITETDGVRDESGTQTVIERIAALGCAIAIDDFGTGYSSLVRLQQLPFTKLKIDQSFIASLLSRKDSRKIVNAVIGLSQSLGLDVVAEGVETQEQRELLWSMGCGYGQGYLFSKACPAADVPALYAQFGIERFRPRRNRMSLEEKAYQAASIYESSEIAIGFLGPEGQLLDASESFHTRLETDPDETVGKRVAEMPAAAQAYFDGMNFDSDGSSDQSARVARATGEIDVVNAREVRDELGEMLGTSMIAFDQTALVEA